MRKTYTLIKGTWKDGILYEEWFWDSRVPALMCGASNEQKQTYQDQSSLFHQMTNQAQQVFGNSSQIFQDLTKAFAPIVAAGPDQEGFSPGVKSALESKAITDTGQAYRNAATAVKQANAAVGGGTMALPGGAEIGQNLAVANSAAEQTSKNLLDVNLASKQAGREQFNAAAGVLSGAPSVFNAATGAGSAASGAGANAAQTANEISQANNSWVNAVTGLAGGVLGSVASGGMKALGTGSKIPSGGYKVPDSTYGY